MEIQVDSGCAATNAKPEFERLPCAYSVEKLYFLETLKFCQRSIALNNWIVFLSWTN
jgi:hypothetical protein